MQQHLKIHAHNRTGNYAAKKIRRRASDQDADEDEDDDDEPEPEQT